MTWSSAIVEAAKTCFSFSVLFFSPRTIFFRRIVERMHAGAGLAVRRRRVCFPIRKYLGGKYHILVSFLLTLNRPFYILMLRVLLLTLNRLFYISIYSSIYFEVHLYIYPSTFSITQWCPYRLFVHPVITVNHSSKIRPHLLVSIRKIYT